MDLFPKISKNKIWLQQSREVRWLCWLCSVCLDALPLLYICMPEAEGWKTPSTHEEELSLSLCVCDFYYYYLWAWWHNIELKTGKFESVPKQKNRSTWFLYPSHSFPSDLMFWLSLRDHEEDDHKGNSIFHSWSHTEEQSRANNGDRNPLDRELES